jgi:hypothetical protein
MCKHRLHDTRQGTSSILQIVLGSKCCRIADMGFLTTLSNDDCSHWSRNPSSERNTLSWWLGLSYRRFAPRGKAHSHTPLMCRGSRSISTRLEKRKETNESKRQACKSTRTKQRGRCFRFKSKVQEGSSISPPTEKKKKKGQHRHFPSPRSIPPDRRPNPIAPRPTKNIPLPLRTKKARTENEIQRCDSQLGA